MTKRNTPAKVTNARAHSITIGRDDREVRPTQSRLGCHTESRSPKLGRLVRTAEVLAQRKGLAGERTR